MSYPRDLLPQAGEIRKWLPTEMRGMEIRVFDTLDSTNTEAGRWLSRGKELPFLLVAHAQTAGKGRLGRSFYSPAGSGLYLTLVYRVGGSMAEAVHVTSAAAVGVCQAVSEVCGKDVFIKWVNDLYLDGKKVGGILAEAVTSPNGCDIILGIGINVTTRDFPSGMRHPAGALMGDEDTPIDQSRLCGTVVKRVFEYLDPTQREACLQGYRERLLLTGRRVICSRNFAPDGTPDLALSVEGIVEGVDDDYGLILRLADGTRKVLYGGEISITLN